ncbi:MAG: glycine cleavage system aminomethyltransferase GcvT [Candidatus Omnitrophota bacterium]
MSWKNTPLIEEHKELGAKLAPFGGWLMPIQYTGIIAEHNWTRSSCSLFDICHMGEFIIHGNPDENNLEKIITLNIKKIECSSCRYGFILDENGGIMDDVIIYKIEPDKYMLVVNAATTDTDLLHLRMNIPEKFEIENLSPKLAKLDLQGPCSRDVLSAIAGDGIASLKYYSFGKFSVLGEEIIISRTGYTGELGYELYISNEKVVQLWEMLLQDGRVKPAGLGARDTLRLEMSYPLYGQDINKQTNPLDAGLEKFIDLSKDFIGKGRLMEKIDPDSEKKLCCFITESRRAPRHDYNIYKGEEKIGIVTSGSFSPSLSCGIGMGYVQKEYSRIGNEIILKEGPITLNAKIVDRPFYKQGTARA